MSERVVTGPVAAEHIATPARLWWRVLAAVAVALALLVVFGAYLQPDMAFQMAQQLWSCF